MIYNSIEDLKSNSEDGWDLFELKRESFSLYLLLNHIIFKILLDIF